MRLTDEMLWFINVYLGCKQTIVHYAKRVIGLVCTVFVKEKEHHFSRQIKDVSDGTFKLFFVVWKGRLCKRKQYFAHVSCCEKGRKKKLIVFLAFNKRCFLRLSCFSWETFLHQWQILSILTSTENTNTQLEAFHHKQSQKRIKMNSDLPIKTADRKGWN